MLYVHYVYLLTLAFTSFIKETTNIWEMKEATCDISKLYHSVVLWSTHAMEYIWHFLLWSTHTVGYKCMYV